MHMNQRWSVIREPVLHSTWISNQATFVDLMINGERHVTDCTYTHDKFYTHMFKKEYRTEVTNNVTHYMLVPKLPPQGEKK